MAERKKSTIKKVAIFHCGFIYTGGGERIVLEEISGLRKKGYSVDCYVPTYDPKLSYPDIIDKYGIKPIFPQLPRFVPLRFAFQLIATCSLIPLIAYRYKDYDFLIGANQPGAYLAWVVSNIIRKPYIVYLSQPNRVLFPRDHEDWQNVTDYFVLNKVINNKLFRRFVEFIDRRSITGSENLFINGSFVAKEINKVYKPKSWVDCPGGANSAPRSVLRTDRKKGTVRANGSVIKKPYVLFTSRHEPWKKFDWAIQVMEKVVKKYPDVRLVIPGAETTLTPRLKTLAKDLDIEKNIVFTDEINQKSLWRLYQNAYCYIFTSPKEDLGIVVQEAQAAGVPVVAWKIGGPTVTTVDRKTGYLVEPYALTKMADKIVYLLKNPAVRNKMGRNAWNHIAKKYTWEKHVEIIEKEMKKVI